MSQASTVRWVRRGCRGYVEGAVGVSEQRMCGRCGVNRSMHRRVRVLNGVENTKEGTMASTSESGEMAGAHARLVELVRVAMEEDQQGSLHIGCFDAGKWLALRAAAGYPAVKLSGDRNRMFETFSITVGYFTLHAQGPCWKPSVADYSRMLDERIA